MYGCFTIRTGDLVRVEHQQDDGHSIANLAVDLLPGLDALGVIDGGASSREPSTSGISITGLVVSALGN